MSRDDRPFQVSYPLGFLAKAAAMAALACALGLIILRWVFFKDLGDEFAPAFYLLQNLIRFLVPALVFSLLAVMLVAACAIFAVAVFASHKLAGPLFRLQRVAGYLGRGALIGRIHLRAGDEGGAVAAGINAWMERRKARFSALRQHLDRIDEALRACEMALDQPDAAALKARVRDLAGTVRDVKMK